MARAAHSHDIGWYCDCGGWIRGDNGNCRAGSNQTSHFYHYQGQGPRRQGTVRTATGRARWPSHRTSGERVDRRLCRTVLRDVEEFLRENPCESMLRVHLEIHDDDDDTVLAAIAWVDMPNSESAEELHDLVENPDKTRAASSWIGRRRHARLGGRAPPQEARCDGS